MGAAELTRGGLEQDFHPFWGDLGTLFCKLFGHRGSKFEFVRASFQVSFYWFLNRNCDSWGCQFQVLAGKYCKKQLFTEVVFIDYGVEFCCLLDALGAVFLVLAVLKTGWKLMDLYMYIFWGGGGSRIPSPINHDGLVALKLLNNRSTNQNGIHKACNLSISPQFPNSSVWWPLTSRGRWIFAV